MLSISALSESAKNVRGNTASGEGLGVRGQCSDSPKWAGADYKSVERWNSGGALSAIVTPKYWYGTFCCVWEAHVSPPVPLSPCQQAGRTGREVGGSGHWAAFCISMPTRHIGLSDREAVSLWLTPVPPCRIPPRQHLFSYPEERRLVRIWARLPPTSSF